MDGAVSLRFTKIIAYGNYSNTPYANMIKGGYRMITSFCLCILVKKDVFANLPQGTRILAPIN